MITIVLFASDVVKFPTNTVEMMRKSGKQIPAMLRRRMRKVWEVGLKSSCKIP